MATFFVGQRVRIVGPAGCRSMGRSARITSTLARRLVDVFGFPSEMDVYRISVDGDGELTPEGAFHARRPCDLEPILPSGHAASTESFQELMDRLNTQRVEKVEEAGA